jgi:hypothetical protein
MQEKIGSPLFIMIHCTYVLEKLYVELEILYKACFQSFISGLHMICYALHCKGFFQKEMFGECFS